MNLIIRKIQNEDAPRLVQYANNKNIWLNVRDYFPHPYTLSDAHGYIDMVSSSLDDHIYAMANEDGLIGIVGVHRLKDVYSLTAEIGYWLGEPFWGLGYTTEAVQWIVSHVWQNSDIIRIEAGIYCSNVSSMRVLEKCGFYREVIRKNRILKDGQIMDEHGYVIMRSKIM